MAMFVADATKDWVIARFFSLLLVFPKQMRLQTAIFSLLKSRSLRKGWSKLRNAWAIIGSIFFFKNNPLIVLKLNESSGSRTNVMVDHKLIFPFFRSCCMMIVNHVFGDIFTEVYVVEVIVVLLTRATTNNILVIWLNKILMCIHC